MNVREWMLCLVIIVVLFALFAGAFAPKAPDPGAVPGEESALIHGNVVHDEPILLGPGADQIIIQPY